LLNVVLLRYTPDPEKTIAAAAKLCYSEDCAEDLYEGMDDEEAAKFLGILVGMGHLSPIEHISFTFSISGVSRSLTHQLVRHRIASFSQRSQRYVTESGFEYITPPSIQGNEKALVLYEEAMAYLHSAYDNIRNELKGSFVAELQEQGVSSVKAKAAAEKLANEDARFILPNACETKIVGTMNARELLHFFSVRCCERAQWEIRALADEMLRLVKPLAPTVFKNAGPKCLAAPCQEGAMSCGNTAQIREKYSSF